VSGQLRLWLRVHEGWDSGGILWRSVPGCGWMSGQLRLWLRVHEGWDSGGTGLDVGPTASAGRKSLRPQVPSAAGAFGRRCLRPQVPSAARAFGRPNCLQQCHELPLSDANRACAHGQRSAAVGVCWSDAHWISCSLKRERLQQTCLLLLLSTRRNAISLIYRLSAALGMRHTRSPGAALAQPWHTPARSRHAPRHTGTHRHTPARSRHAPRHTNTQAAVVSFLHSSISLPPHASRPAASRTVKTANPERKSRTGNSSSLLLSCLSALPQDPQQQSVAPPNAPPAATAAANAANAANAAPARRQHHAPQLQRPLPRHQPSGAP